MHRSSKSYVFCFFLLLLLAFYLQSRYVGDASVFPGRLGEAERILTTGTYPLPLVSAPTVTASLIDRVLAVNHSPAAGLGTIFYQAGVKAHINPAIALAFFHKESTYGTQGIARVTKGIGNIRCSLGYDCYQGFRKYPTWITGISDWYNLIQTVYVSKGLSTVELAIPVYAPPSDHNDVPSYIQVVRSDVERWQTGEV